eukprot:gene18148-biopygen1520
MSLPAEPSPLPPQPHREHETLIQYNLRNKVCAYCKRPGARLKCEGCRQRSYCDRKCQKRDWKQEHRGQCVKLQQVFVPPPPGWRGAAAAEGAAASGGGGAAAAAGGGGGAPTVVIDEEDEIENLCPICLDNEDDAIVDGEYYGMCFACGQFYCGACKAGGLADRSPNCPTCRAPFTVSDEEDFKRCWKLVHDRSAGRHTPAAQCSLGALYSIGKGVEQDHVEAAKWFRKAAEAGYAAAQNNLGNMYDKGKGVEQDHVEAIKWFRKAAEAGYAAAQNNLGNMYDKGKGVEQDHVEAAKWLRKSAEAGFAQAQYNLGAMYFNGEGVEEDFSKAVRWMQLAAVQGFKDALKILDVMQQNSVISTPPPGTAITTILLTSANAAKYNNRTGRVVAPTEGTAIKPGRAAVLLDGEAAPISFKLKNLQIHPPGGYGWVKGAIAGDPTAVAAADTT